MFVALHCYRKKEHVMQGEPPFQQSAEFDPVPPFGEVRSPKAQGKYKKSAKKAEKECNIPVDNVYRCITSARWSGRCANRPKVPMYY